MSLKDEGGKKKDQKKRSPLCFGEVTSAHWFLRRLDVA